MDVEAEALKVNRLWSGGSEGERQQVTGAVYSRACKYLLMRTATSSPSSETITDKSGHILDGVGKYNFGVSRADVVVVFSNELARSRISSRVRPRSLRLLTVLIPSQPLTPLIFSPDSL